jgi:hypothetical protein
MRLIMQGGAALLAGLWLLAPLAGCGEDAASPRSCAQPAGSCPNICAGGVGVLGESCGSPSDCQCGLFCDEGQCAPYEGALAGCACLGGEVPIFPTPPAPVERCNDGTVGYPCDDGNPCTEVGVCDAERVCVAAPVTYAAACDDGNPCTTRDTCAGATCLGSAREDGAACEDGDLCSGQDTCVAGVCVVGTPPDCAGLDDPCNEGACDPFTGGCVAVPVGDGQSCDDGSRCTDGDACQRGVCAGSARDCAGLGDDCNPSSCDPETGLCVRALAEDGAPCEDGDLCTAADTCAGGSCQPGDGVQCDDPCVVGACNPETGRCEGPPVEDGAGCDDGELCTERDVCVAGVCVGQMDACFCEGMPDGTACDDFNPCTMAAACEGGACVGAGALDCSRLDSACSVGYCDPETGACAAAPVLPGTICDDGDPCTEEDACFNGACQGSPKDCSGQDAACRRGVCDPRTGACGAEDRLDGTACNNGDMCVIGEACEGGACVGGNNQCGPCEALAPGSACDDGDPCTLGDTCALRDGVKLCEGEALDCAGLDQGCAVGACDPATVTCVMAPAEDGLGCDDQEDCTAGDACAAGSCLGQPFPTCDGQPNLCEPFAPIDTVQSARALVLEQGELLVRGRVEDLGESDWYSVALEADERLTVETGPDCGSSLDTFLALRGADGQAVVASNDDADGQPWARLVDVVVPRTGTYYVQVRSFATASSSSYLLRLERRPPPRCAQDSDCGCAQLSCGEDGRCGSPLAVEVEPNGADAPTLAAVGAQVRGELESALDVDWFRVALEGGVPVNITTSEFCGAPTDTELRLFAANGVTELFFNDDAQGGVSAALLAITPPSSGEYLIQVRGHDLAVGAYQLGVEDARCQQDSDCGCEDLRCDVDAGRRCVPRGGESEPNDDLARAQVVALEERVVGRIAAPREVDYFAVNLPRGEFTVETSGLCGGSGDTEIQLISPEGEVMARDDDSGEGRYARLRATIGAARRYYVRVSWRGLGQGDYVLRVTP